MAKINLTTPVGRLVGGSLYKGNDKDADGNPLLTKSGPNQGQPRMSWFAALAIPKGAEQHWAQTEWGQKIYQAGAAGAPNLVQSPKFAWKVDDGDSTIPNTKGKRNCDREGYPGHWILRISSGFAPKVYQLVNGSPVPFPEEDAVKLGYYVQANIDVDFNGSTQQPGMYLNHSMYCLIGYGTEIYSGPDVASAGFGAAPAPAGMMAMPPAAPAGALAPPPAAPAGLPPLPGAAPAPAGLPPLPGAAPAPAPSLPPLPAAPAPAPAPAGLVPVPGAAHSIETLRAGGWTDDQIVQGGFATRPAAAPAAPSLPPLPPATSAPAAPPPAAPIAPAAPVTPNVQFVQPPAPPAAPGGLVMIAAGTVEQWRAQGWSDDQLVAAGHARRA